LKALTSDSCDFSKQGLVADAANPSTDFFNEIEGEADLPDVG
jgi:hypothetical protein